MFLRSRALALTLMLAGLASTQAFAQATPKIAYIKSQTILQQTPNREAINAQLQKVLAPLQARMKAIDDSNKALIEAYQKDSPTLTAAAKQDREKLIGDRQAVWGREVDSLRAVAEQKQAEVEQPMIEALRKVLNEIRTEDGLWVIYDLDSPGHGIVAVDRNLEITDKVLAKYRVAAASIKPDSSRTVTGTPGKTTTGVGRIIPPSS